LAPDARARTTLSQEEGKGKSALRSVALEIPINPVKGLSSSSARKIAPENESAHTNRETATTMLVRANSLKLTNIVLSQKNRITRNGVGIEPAGLRKQLEPELRNFRESLNGARLQ
jgi:hypothetical protein